MSNKKDENMNLKRKMKNYGKKVLANKPSDNTLRKQRRMVQKLRRTLRERMNEEELLIEHEMEKNSIMKEYLGTDGTG